MTHSTDRPSWVRHLAWLAVLAFFVPLGIALVVLWRAITQQAGSAVDRPDPRATGRDEPVIELPHDEGPPGTVLGEPGGQHTQAVVDVAFTPDGKTLASASADGTIRLWDVPTGKTRVVLPDSGQKDHRHGVYRLAVSPDGTRLASVAWGDGTVRVWDPTTGRPTGSFKALSRSVLSLAFSPDGTLAVGGEGRPPPPSVEALEGELRLWDVATAKEVAALTITDGVVNSVAFTPDGKTLLSGGSIELGMWDVPSLKERGHLGKIAGGMCLALTRDGRLLACGSYFRTVKLWDVEGRREVATLEGHRHDIFRVAFTPDGELLATASDDGTVKLWDVKSRKELLTLTATGEGREAWCVVFSPDGKKLAAGMRETVKLWDVPGLLGRKAGE
jgi:WD40 repeat protein